MKRLLLLLICFSLYSLTTKAQTGKSRIQDLSDYNLIFNYLPLTWDEGLPLGNGEIGALIWQKNERLRMSLDHVGLWDLRETANQTGEEFRFAWVKEQWEKNEYQKVQALFDQPYETAPAPSKIPGGALEFDTGKLGEVQGSSVDIASGMAEVEWSSGAKLSTFVHATMPIGWFKFEGITLDSIEPSLVIPEYNLAGESDVVHPISGDGQDLRSLGYPKGIIEKLESGIIYTQPGHGGFEYHITVRWQKTEDGLEGCWSISTNRAESSKDSRTLTENALQEGFEKALTGHLIWWKAYWDKSSISVPDSILERQWYLEQYKFGSAARADTPPISLQAVWTADNGKLPPWKGDFHHDLNTQLSYWPSYTANHLDLAKGFLNWLWKNYPTFKNYTETYFETDGVNVPGVSTLSGEPMGGWIQYSFGPTVSAWLSHHFYLQWRYSMDREFLEKEAYPWFKEVAIYLDQVSELDQNGFRTLPISSSPEIHDSSREAWFEETTNFDLANIRFTFTKAAELATELGLAEDAKKWNEILNEWPDYAIDHTGMMVAPGESLTASHRHFSHLMAIHPFGLINWSDGEEAQEIIRNTLQNLTTTGASAWVGYSFSWLGNLQARMLDGEGAAESLRIFATSFCLPNSFHVNGDQSGKGYTDFTYRPFTLEGNFAFAAGVQEMLLQSHEEFIRLFPAIPANWEDVGFQGFLAEGAFEIDAEKANANEVTAEIKAPKGGRLRILNPLGADGLANGKPFKKDEVWTVEMKPGDRVKVVFRQ